MIVKPTSVELSKKAGNCYRLVNAIAKRARQIQDGSNVLIKTDELSVITVAALELDEDKYIVN